MQEKYARMSITALEYFAKKDTHAMQYSLIAKSLLTAALEYLERREVHERLQRTETSSQLFGLVPRDNRNRDGVPVSASRSDEQTSGGDSLRDATPMTSTQASLRDILGVGFASADVDDLIPTASNPMSWTPDPSSLGEGIFEGEDQAFGSLNLFPLLDGGGHIGLSHCL